MSALHRALEIGLDSSRRAQGLPGTLAQPLLHRRKQHTRLTVQHAGDPIQLLDRNAHFSALNATHVAAIQAAGQRNTEVKEEPIDLETSIDTEMISFTRYAASLSLNH